MLPRRLVHSTCFAACLAAAALPARAQEAIDEPPATPMALGHQEFLRQLDKLQEPALPAVRVGGVPMDAQVAAIGVHRAAGDRPVRVEIARSRRPLVLSLASTEAVNWQLDNKGRRLVAVLLSGAKASTVSGTKGRVVVIGPQAAHSRDSIEFLHLKRQIGLSLANPLQAFQGEYEGSSFLVQGR
jgi:hypothetical protein